MATEQSASEVAKAALTDPAVRRAICAALDLPVAMWKVGTTYEVVLRSSGKTISRYQQLGPMPDDPLLANMWAHRALGVSLLNIVNDPRMDEDKRVAKICEISARMAALTPLSRTAAAENTIMGRTAATAGGPKMEPASASEVPTVGAAGGGPPARRGRPRKRQDR